MKERSLQQQCSIELYQWQKQEPLGSDSKGVNCLAYDEAIMAQQDRIQQEIAQVEKQTSVADLLASFNDQSTSDYLVVYLRLLTSGYLQRQSKFFEHFIEGGRTVKEFCQQEVEPMCKKSDHIHIIALAQALSVSNQVEYMDHGEGGTTNPHTFPEGSELKVYLLYRPGHYNILYK
uniref:OTU domain-containing protein n=1 Tax=Suricata suricatta TaxID=37032 RepID=A0A673VHW8_SURSU